MVDKPNFIIVNSSEIAKDKNLNLSAKYWIDKKEQLIKDTLEEDKTLIKRNYCEK